jgi:dTMP kinase
MFITIEGVEGTGKSTLAKALIEHLRSLGREVLATREPGGTPIGDRLREIFLDADLAMRGLTEAMIVNAARAELVHAVIRPALESGKIVVCDRYSDATYAYQGHGRRIPMEILRQTCEMATGGLEPNLTLLLDLEPAAGLARQRGMKPDRIEREDLDFHRRVREGYLEIAATRPRFRVIDAAQSPEAVLSAALRYVEAVLPFFADKRI